MPLTAGDRLGAYEILIPLGVGGMGEVYRARDTKLGRDVALKILPVTVADDPDRIARFKREAQVLAALNHPHIAAIYGFDADGATQFLVMELVDDETLADRLKRGPIPVDEAIAIARQIAEALAEAHDKGIIHRDLKPANVALSGTDQVKVLDFGLAKLAASPAVAGASSLSMSPTLTTPAMITGVGMILGTAAYMAPEQAKGRDADKRCDVWAFGCVLYEMLTAKRAFEGEDITDTIAAIMRSEPDWSALPLDTPANARTVLEGCLKKDRRQRIADIAVAQFLLSASPAATPVSAEVSRPPPAARRSRALAGVGVIVGAALAAGIGWWIGHSAPPAKLQTMRFAIVPPAELAVGATLADRQLAISPDGTNLVYVSGYFGSGQLVIRAIDQIDAAPVRGITNARAPFMSPDGKWIAYGDGTNELRKVSITGGSPITLCKIAAPLRGGTWGPDGTIVFAITSGRGLFTVPAGGGDPKELTKPDVAHGEFRQWYPSFLPNGRAVLYTISGPSEGVMANAQVAVLDLKTGRSKTLVRGGSQAEYVDVSTGSRQPGVLVYAVARSLRAVRLDPNTLEVIGDPVSVVEQVATVPSGAAQYTVSRTGTLVYVPGGSSTVFWAAIRTLVWIDRRGRETPVAVPPRSYASVRLSPDGSKIALDARDQEQDIWTFDLARQTLSRLTMDPGIDGYPLWTPDGRRIIFESNRTGVFNLYAQAADGTGAAEPLTKSPNPMWPFSIAPDGTRIVLHETGEKTGDDIDVLTLDGKSQPEPLIQTPFSEQHGEISPDGRWLAYDSNESGQQQVYVRPFPNVNGGHWQVSPAGGMKPVWAHNGKELFYLTGRAMMAVPIQTTSGFSAGNPTKLFEGNYFAGGIARVYDVSRDDQQFLMIKEPQTDAAGSTNMIAVVNWIEELKARVPIK